VGVSPASRPRFRVVSLLSTWSAAYDPSSPEPAWWRSLDDAQRRSVMRHAFSALPAELASTLLACDVGEPLVLADEFGVDTRWYLTREAAAAVTGLARDRGLAHGATSAPRAAAHR